MIELPEEFLLRMKAQLKDGFDGFLKSYDRPAERAVRINTLKISENDFDKISPLCSDGVVPWEQSGRFVCGDGLGKTVLHAAGAYYVQEPSAMCAVPELRLNGNERVLDLCAAPGGKTTQIAARLQGGVLVANEINSDRYNVLKSNLERCGVKNAVVLNKSPDYLAEIFENYFDKILVDAPCSGEGMFKKEPNAVPEWSAENVKKCALRQKEILACADKMLAVGGRLVYSTCTFAPEEDEEQIAQFLDGRADYALIGMKKLYPHEVRGEGHFCAVLEKRVGARNDLALYESRGDSPKLIRLYREWESDTLIRPLNNISTFGSDKNLYAVFAEIPDLTRSVKNYGSAAGVFLGSASADMKRFEPSHRLAMCLKTEDVKHVDVDEKTALTYLRGLTFGCDSCEKGWRIVSYCGLPLGWCKAVGGIAKNHLPKGLRI